MITYTVVINKEEKSPEPWALQYLEVREWRETNKGKRGEIGEVGEPRESGVLEAEWR